MTDPERMAERIIDHLAATITAADPQGPTSTPPTAEELLKFVESLRPTDPNPGLIVTTPAIFRRAEELINQPHRPSLAALKLATLRLSGIRVELADTPAAAYSLAGSLAMQGIPVMLLTDPESERTLPSSTTGETPSPPSSPPA